MIAQSSCAVCMSHNPVGWVYAVRRDCSSEVPTCAEVCSGHNLERPGNAV